MKHSQEQEKKKGIWYLVGSIAFAAAMYVIMPKLIERISDSLYRKNQHPVKPQEEEDWGPEIVRKSTLEETDDGAV